MFTMFCYFVSIDLDIRLQSSEYAGQGRLELYHSGIWGTVRALNEHQSEVICRQLGYESVMEIYDEAVFGIGDGPIWDMETITCYGKEDNLRECTSDWDGRLVGDQDHTQDMSMMCRPYGKITVAMNYFLILETQVLIYDF